MRATGIVRRLDDLGRVVIPKELRRVVGLSEGDPVEMFIEPDSRMICLGLCAEEQESSLVDLLEKVREHDDLPEYMEGTVELLINCLKEDK